MATFFDTLTAEHRAFIAKQPVFFVATSAAEGRINLSPKGYDAFRILDDKRVAYLDLAGSGNETHAHLVADGRLTIMFCSFAGPPLILRIYGQGRPILPGDPSWTDAAAHFELLPGTRQIFEIQIESVQTSCGYGVPIMELKKERPTLVKHHAQTDPQKWLEKTAGRNTSIDGLPTRASTVYFGGPNKVASD